MATFVWSAAVAGNWSTGANWKVGGVAQASPPTAADDAVFGTGAGATNSNCTTAAGDVCRSLTVDNAYTGTITFANSATALTVGDGSGGAVVIGSGCVIANAGSNAGLVLASTANNGGAGWDVSCAVTFAARLRANGAGGRWTLKANLTNSVTASNALRASAGTFDCNGFSVSFTGTTQGGITVDGGTLILGTGTFSYALAAAQTFFTYTSGTVTAGSETHSLTGTGNLVRTFAGGGQGYGHLRHDAASGTGSLTVTGANTFASIGCVAGRTVRLPASTITNVGQEGLTNVKGTLNSATGGTAATIAVTIGATMIAATLQDITATPAGAVYALDSTNTSGNSGIVFSPPDQLPQKMAPQSRVPPPLRPAVVRAARW